MKRNTHHTFRMGSFDRTSMSTAFMKALNNKLKEEGKNLRTELEKLQQTRKENL